MIDTDKYEGHTEGPWEVDSHLDEKAYSTILDGNENEIASYVSWCNDALIADAPLLLAEVKRLRYIVDSIPDEVWNDMKTWEAMKGVIE